jgi:hypothetical protein
MSACQCICVHGMAVHVGRYGRYDTSCVGGYKAFKRSGMSNSRFLRRLLPSPIRAATGTDWNCKRKE